jgi:hypothetical protein
MDTGIVGLSRASVFALFPNLRFDTDFEITSDASDAYNCIAWAYGCAGRWMWPRSKQYPAFVRNRYFWPQDVESSMDVSAFMEAFKRQGYQLCAGWDHEVGYQKIALYVKIGTTECTHASRELVEREDSRGGWTSKLGPMNDIRHGSPYGVEGDDYGVVYCFMKKELPS